MSKLPMAKPNPEISRGLSAVFALHRLEIRIQCGARSIPVAHHHSTENDRKPGPLRTLRCSEPYGHEGDHRDAVCCYRFQTFADWQVASVEPMTHTSCTNCGRGEWPCDTILAVQDAQQEKTA